MDLGWFARLHNLNDSELAALVDATPLHALKAGGLGLAFDPDHWQRAAEQLLAGLARYHARLPDSAGATPQELRGALADRPDVAVVTSLLETLIAAGLVVRIGARHQLAGHQIKLSEAEQLLWERAAPLLAQAALAPPQVPELAQQLHVNEAALRELFCRLARMGRLHRVRREVFFLPQTVAALAAQTEALAKTRPKGSITVGPFRELTGLHRNLGIPMLEFFDRSGFTLRLADGRRVQRASAQVFGDGSEAAA